jgi:phosphohistidine phosphatase
MARHFRNTGIEADLVLCSSAERARRTLVRLKPVLASGIEIRYEPDLYGAGPEELLDRLRRLPAALSGVLVVGHNPTLHELAMDLAGGGDPDLLARLAAKYPTGALASLSFEGSWTDLFPGVATLEGFVVPSDLE